MGASLTSRSRLPRSADHVFFARDPNHRIGLPCERAERGFANIRRRSPGVNASDDAGGADAGAAALMNELLRRDQLLRAVDAPSPAPARAGSRSSPPLARTDRILF